MSTQLEEALSEVAAAGFPEAAERARQRCFAAYTTSSELMGETGLAIRELLPATGSSLPRETRAKLDACLREVGRVWPKLWK